MYRMYGIPALQEQKAGDVQDVGYAGDAAAKAGSDHGFYKGSDKKEL